VGRPILALIWREGLTEVSVVRDHSVYCIDPAYVNTFNRLFAAHSTARMWNNAAKLLEQIDNLLDKR